MRHTDDDYRAALRRAYGPAPVDAVTTQGIGVPRINEWAHVHQTHGGAFVEATIWVPDTALEVDEIRTREQETC